MEAFNLFDVLGTGFTSAIGWFGDLLDALLTSEGVLIPAFTLISVGFGLGLLGRGFSWVKGLLWGY